MFLYGNIALQVIPIFTFGNIGTKAIVIFPNGKIPVGGVARPGYSKYWNLFVEKAKVTVKPSPGSDAAMTSMPIFEHRRATR